jgi:hypothetical protein
MKSRLLILFYFSILALGCSKDQNQIAPTIKLKSYSDQVINGTFFNALLTYSQKNGNLSGDSLVILRRRYNLTQVPPDQVRDTFITTLPETPDASKAEFTASLDWSIIQYGINGENDTCDFRFILIDQKGNHSDTVTTGKVIIVQ